MLSASLSRRARAPLAAAVLLLAFGGCDTLVEDDVVVLRKEVTFRFDFSTVGRDLGAPLEVGSESTVDIEQILFGEGYSREEVLLANIRSVEIERTQPVNTNLNAFERINFTMTASGMNVPTLASSDDLPDDRSAALRVLVPGVTEIVTKPEFGARLVVVPNVEEDFVLRATVDLRLDVEGI